MTTIKGVKKLTKNELKFINASGVGSRLRRHQSYIRRAQNAEPFDEAQRRSIITSLIQDQKKCYEGTNVL